MNFLAVIPPTTKKVHTAIRRISALSRHALNRISYFKPLEEGHISKSNMPTCPSLKKVRDALAIWQSPYKFGGRKKRLYYYCKGGRKNNARRALTGFLNYYDWTGNYFAHAWRHSTDPLSGLQVSSLGKANSDNLGYRSVHKIAAQFAWHRPNEGFGHVEVAGEAHNRHAEDRMSAGEAARKTPLHYLFPLDSLPQPNRTDKAIEGEITYAYAAGETPTAFQSASIAARALMAHAYEEVEAVLSGFPLVIIQFPSSMPFGIPAHLDYQADVHEAYSLPLPPLSWHVTMPMVTIFSLVSLPYSFEEMAHLPVQHADVVSSGSPHAVHESVVTAVGVSAPSHPYPSEELSISEQMAFMHNPAGGTPLTQTHFGGDTKVRPASITNGPHPVASHVAGAIPVSLIFDIQRRKHMLLFVVGAVQPPPE